MTKIAVAAEGKNITGHFGHCENFLLYEIKDGQIIKEETIDNPGHRPGFLPNFLADQGVRTIISGNMGEGARDIFLERNIEVIVGVLGDAKTAVKSYLTGHLQSDNRICQEHQHDQGCGGACGR
ncbi:MAG: dinitrogenase iron-molybdenum cofactor [Clostridia bacterium]|nr:dinitrogenase iron-molybdenum cofactor [Clostridia bacterium]